MPVLRKWERRARSDAPYHYGRRIAANSSRAFSFFAEGALDDFALFLFVAFGGAAGRGGGGRARDAGEGKTIEDFIAELNLDEIPRAHVFGFFLDPVNGRAVGIGLQHAAQSSIVERVKLFHANDGHILALGFFTMLEEVVIDFSGAQQEAFRGGGRDGCVRYNGLEPALG